MTNFISPYYTISDKNLIENECFRNKIKVAAGASPEYQRDLGPLTSKCLIFLSRSRCLFFSIITVSQ